MTDGITRRSALVHTLGAAATGLAIPRTADAATPSDAELAFVHQGGRGAFGDLWVKRMSVPSFNSLAPDLKVASAAIVNRPATVKFGPYVHALFRKPGSPNLYGARGKLDSGNWLLYSGPAELKYDASAVYYHASVRVYYAGSNDDRLCPSDLNYGGRDGYTPSLIPELPLSQFRITGSPYAATLSDKLYCFYPRGRDTRIRDLAGGI